MFAITGITGNVGGEVARHLLAAGKHIRAVLRDARKGAAWEARGCEVAIADIGDGAALADAFAGAEGVFILVPPSFDPEPGFPEARATAGTLLSALKTASPARIVYLSTIGAQAKQSNLLSQHTIIEQTLGELAIPITFLRPGWFMENASLGTSLPRANRASSRASCNHSTSRCRWWPQPISGGSPPGCFRKVGMATASSSWKALIESPRNEIARTFENLLQERAVRAESVPRESWESLFRSQGMKNPAPRVQMLDGFNEGWVEFEAGEAGSRKGEIGLEAVLKRLIEEAA